MKKLCPRHGIYEGNRCPECKKELNKAYDRIKRNKKAQYFYASRQWKKVRDIVMKKHGGLCQECLKCSIVLMSI